MPWRIAALASVTAAILARLVHLPLVWVEEAYGMAAAAELLRGKALYADIWFDKPPLYAWFYTVCGAQMGWPLRLLDSALLVLIAVFAWRAGRALWGEREGLAAAALLCFALTFWFPSAVIAVAPDFLMIAPHLVAIWLAATKRPLYAGIAAGAATLCNSKGVLVLIVAALWDWRSAGTVLLGFVGVQAAALAVVPRGEYWRQVWEWGFRYSADTFISNPLAEGVQRTAGWVWFNGTLCTGAVWYLFKTRDRRMILWLVVSVLGVAGGLRFFPRYYFHLLPVAALAAGCGLVMMPRVARILSIALLLIPLVRFGPRFVSLSLHGAQGWADVALMEDSRRVAAVVGKHDVLVWGYRPDVFVFSGAAAATRFLDSQPLTGVIADRHLVRSDVSYRELSRVNRSELVRTAPTMIVDGLGRVNPDLAITAYPDLRGWLAQYQEVSRTPLSIVYRRR